MAAAAMVSGCLPATMPFLRAFWMISTALVMVVLCSSSLDANLGIKSSGSTGFKFNPSLLLRIFTLLSNLVFVMLVNETTSRGVFGIPPMIQAV